jgi:hypothetical protein
MQHAQISLSSVAPLSVGTNIRTAKHLKNNKTFSKK